MIFIHLLKLRFLQMTDLSRPDMLLWGLNTLYKNTHFTPCVYFHGKDGGNEKFDEKQFIGR